MRTAGIFSLLLIISLPMAGQVYLDPEASVDERVEDLLSRMTLAEKIGQMTQTERSALSGTRISQISTYYLGSVLSGGGSTPNPNTIEAWVSMYNAMQQEARSTRLGIPILYGVDAVHGHNNLRGAVIFPHNIGLGCTRNPELVAEIARVTALEVRATGPEWTFGPCVTVPQNIFWGRTYEGYSENTALVDSLTRAAVRGYQHGGLKSDDAVLACAKHFLGDGGTRYGIDQGNTVLTEQELRRIHLPPYMAAVESGVGSIMASFNSWNGLKCHANEYLINGILKSELGFKGFVVSDWRGINQVDRGFKDAIKKSINAGVDMAMQPGDHIQFITFLTALVQEGLVTEDRINDAVRRILRVKFEMGLFERPPVSDLLSDTVGCVTHRELGRQAARESLVLLKNNGVLPVNKEKDTVVVVGFKGDNIGAMCGGWTMTWQGMLGNITPGTSILDGLKGKMGENNVLFTQDPGNIPDADCAVVVVGEAPYAEGSGDVFHSGPARFKLGSQDKALIEAVKLRGIPMVIVLLSGRPLDILDEFKMADAFIAAWLPGTEGGRGIADVLCGDYPPTGKLSYSWPKRFEDVPVSIMGPDEGKNTLFDYGFGLTYLSTSTDFPSANREVRVYPNPFYDRITINLKEAANNTLLYLFDATGRMLRCTAATETVTETPITIPLDDIKPGLYFLMIQNPKYSHTERIIKLSR